MGRSIVSGRRNARRQFRNYPDMMSIHELQNALGIGRTSAYKLISDNKIGHIRVGKSIRIPKISLIKYVEKGLGVCYTGSCSDEADMSCQKGDAEK